MKKLLFTLLLFVFCLNNNYAQETITNESIIQMNALGFDDSMIIEKINSSNVKFNTTIAELSKLNKVGVSSEILALMMKKSKHNTKSKTGIYYVAENDDQKRILPSVFSNSNSNATAQVIVSSYINAKTKSILPKVKSSNVIKGNKPEFVFIFNTSDVDNMQTNQGNQAGLLNWWFRIATSPNEFSLVKFKVKERKNTREIVTGKTSALGSTSGIDAKSAILFSSEELESNKFKVTTSYLEPGEYCFIYSGQVPEGRENQAVFDFSIE
ncbi:MAG: hypothetical protein ACI93N_000393 [Flavobacteriaceae bacterium]|jgi:hypothetical protein